jgi:hypothetical protein
MIGMPRCVACAASSMPGIPGIMMSRTMRFGRSRSSTGSACPPVLALLTRSFPGPLEGVLHERAEPRLLVDDDTCRILARLLKRLVDRYKRWDAFDRSNIAGRGGSGRCDATLSQLLNDQVPDGVFDRAVRVLASPQRSPF